MLTRLFPKKMYIKGTFENRKDILFYYLVPCKKYFLVSAVLKLARKLEPIINKVRDNMKEIE